MYEDKYAEKEKELKSNNYQGKILLLDDFIEDEFYVYETITGDYNNDGIRDKFLIIDTNQEDAMGMRVPFENYLIRIVLGIEDSKKFKFLFESHTILPCLNCEK